VSVPFARITKVFTKGDIGDSRDSSQCLSGCIKVFLVGFKNVAVGTDESYVKLTIYQFFALAYFVVALFTVAVFIPWKSLITSCPLNAPLPQRASNAGKLLACDYFELHLINISVDNHLNCHENDPNA
jgi:hypothetical protein